MKEIKQDLEKVKKQKIKDQEVVQLKLVSIENSLKRFFLILS
ncbi:MAG: hypothetical protein ACR5KW_04470 [Wolbachia sp.]